MSNKYIYVSGKARWARLKEDKRDLGNDKTPDNVMKKIEAAQGFYLMELHGVTKAGLKEAGIPLHNMFGNLLKEDDETGEEFYKCKAPHYKGSYVDKETGETVVIEGPPKVVKADGTDWDWDKDGLIGNDSLVTVKFNHWKGDKSERITMAGVRVDELVPYEEEWENF